MHSVARLMLTLASEMRVSLSLHGEHSGPALVLHPLLPLCPELGLSLVDSALKLPYQSGLVDTLMRFTTDVELDRTS